ncbi:hypothetical protein ACDY96_25945 [Rhizobium mongolense]|uniref:hypothetical protein n=1 Tax=Rhizobium mongolense TaxID=57676 RepID=UPI003556024D
MGKVIAIPVEELADQVALLLDEQCRDINQALNKLESRLEERMGGEVAKLKAEIAKLRKRK